MTVLWSTALVLYRTFLSWDLSDVLLMIRLGSYVWEETAEVKSHFIMTSLRYMLSTGLVTMVVNLDRLDKVMFVRFLHCKIYSYFLFFVQCSLQGGVQCTEASSLLYIFAYSTIYLHRYQLIMDWMFLLTQKSYVETSLFNVMVLAGEAFGRWLVLGGIMRVKPS